MSETTNKAAEIHRSMTPHQMALRIVELEEGVTNMVALMERDQELLDKTITSNSNGIQQAEKAITLAESVVVQRDELLAQCQELERQLSEAKAEARKYKLGGLGLAASMGEATSINSDLQSERDALLAALEGLVECYCEAGGELSRADRAHHRAVYADAQAAIAQAKGGAA